MARFIEKLKTLDEVTLLELLEIKSDELVDAFIEKIIERRGWLCDQLEEDFETDE